MTGELYHKLGDVTIMAHFLSELGFFIFFILHRRDCIH